MRRLITFFAVAAMPTMAYAQGAIVGGDLIYARPFKDFGQNVKQGIGLSGTGLIFKRGSPLALRLDVSILSYGKNRNRSIYELLFRSYTIEKATTNNIVSIGIGPQLMVTEGNFRPYINVQGGFSHYYTRTVLRSLGLDQFETSWDESSNVKLSYGGGGGVMIPIHAGKNPVTLHAGAQYMTSGRTTYLTREDIKPDEETGALNVTPRTTDVRYMTYRLGVTVGF